MRQSWYHIRSLRAYAGAAVYMANTRLGGAGLKALRLQICTCSATLMMMDDGFDNSDTNTSSILGDVHIAEHPTSDLYD